MKTTLNFPAIAPNANPPKRWLSITPILLLAAGLYFYQLGTESLWIDELYSITDSQNPSLSSTRPLYFFLLHVWMRLGTGDAWLRGLGVCFGIGSVFLTYRLGRRLLGESVGLIAAFLLCLSPLFLNHAQEVRMYTLSTFLGLSGTLALTTVLERLSLVYLGGWAIARVLAILTTPLNAILLLPDVALFSWRFRRQRRFWLALGTGIVLISILWLPVAIHIATSSGPEYMSTVSRQPPGVASIVGKLTNFTVFWPLQDLFGGPRLVLWFYLFVTVLLVGLLVFVWFGKPRATQVWVAAWAFLPPATLLAVSYIAPTSLWLPRYLLLTVPYWLILLAASFVKIWCRQRNGAIVIAALYLIAAGGGLTHYYSTDYREDWRGVAQIISVNDQPDDVIALAVANARPDRAIAHYYRGSAPIELLGEYSFSPEQPDFRQRWLQRLTTLDSRLWLVVYWGRNSDRSEIEQIVKSHPQFQVQSYKTLSGPVYLFLVEPKPALSRIKAIE
ncbi:MAG: glycosyltransferase family 39 protein [Cyanophyceae cyanobacterium]